MYFSNGPLIGCLNLSQLGCSGSTSSLDNTNACSQIESSCRICSLCTLTSIKEMVTTEIIYVLESVTLIFLIVDNRCKAGEIVECLKPRNTNAVVKPLTLRKRWKHTKRNCTSLVVSSLTSHRPNNLPLLFHVAFHNHSVF